MEDSFTDKEEDLGAVEEERSVILHLLSQLKLGMDLTRVGRVPISAKTIPLRRQHERVFDKARLAVTEEDFSRSERSFLYQKKQSSKHIASQ